MTRHNPLFTRLSKNLVEFAPHAPLKIGGEGEPVIARSIRDVFHGKQAGIDQDFIDQNEVGILYGNDSVSEAVVEAIDIVKEKKDTQLIGSGAIFKSMN